MNGGLQTELVGIKLRTPLIAASGTFGFGEEYLYFVKQADLGAIVVKGMTRESRPGNAGRRMAETPAGMLNCIGLQNPGVDVFVKNILPRIRLLSVVFFLFTFKNVTYLLEGQTRIERSIYKGHL